jgi:hypothetical protein
MKYMNTKTGTTFGLAMLVIIAAIATMFALGLFGPGKAYAGAPAPISITASPSSPGDTSSIKIGFETDTDIAGNSGELWIGFDAKYGVPASITKTSVSIASGQTTGGVSNPLIDPTIAEQIATSGPFASGDTIIKLQIGDTTPADTTVTGLYQNEGGNDHFVTFATSAGITLPTAASTKEIWLSYDTGTTWSTTTATVDVNAITVVRELTLSATSGARGKSVTATGKGFTGTGNATLWVDTDDGGDIDTSEYIIATDIVVSGGAFEYVFVTDTNFPLTATAINAQGGDGATVATTTNPTFDSYGSITLDKTEVARGATIKITTVDWLASDLSAFKIGGVTQTPPSDVAVAADVDEGFSITVAATTPLGKQKIQVTGNNEGTRYTTVIITGAPVTVSPSTAVAGQEVTVTGTGFTKSSNLATITVGGQTVTNTSSGGLDTSDTIAANVDTDSSGNFSTSFLIPDSSTTRTAGDHKILVTDDGGLTGEVFMAVPGRTLTLSSASSKRGSEVTVTGTGYEAKGTVAMTYLSGTTTTTLGSSTADSYGAFTKVVTIPNTPAIPSTNTITGAITSGGSKTATHKLPASSIELDVSEQSTGANVTITGAGFPAYASVATMTIGGLDVRPTPAPSTNVDGGFTSTVMVPGLTAGNHTVKVTASSVTGSISLKVTATTAEVIAVSTATADVFGDSIAADNLVRVWRFDNATQAWSFYDPRPAFASANTMDDTASGDIVWVNVTVEESFQSGTLYPGWNLISLD